MKSIDTIYNGYRFRSRLEARWAVFFDVLNITYEYEKEGFDLDNSILYLPDFWLPQVNMWAEVKPESFTEEEYGKCKKLVIHTGYECLLLVGLPEVKSYPALMSDMCLNMPDACKKLSCTDCEGHKGIDYKERPLFAYVGGKYFFTNYHNYIKEENRLYWDDESGCDGGFEDTEEAVAAAKSARFEYGEKGCRDIQKRNTLSELAQKLLVGGKISHSQVRNLRMKYEDTVIVNAIHECQRNGYDFENCNGKPKYFDYRINRLR